MGDFDLSKSIFFRFLSEEREEILRLKWIESEKYGFDIGESKAILIWVTKHQKPWRNEFLRNNLTGKAF